jgi:hypothetical protein
MKPFAKIIFVFLLLAMPLGTNASCDKVYSYSETGCRYAPGDDAQMKFMQTELLPIIADYYGENKTSITKLLIVMTIDEQGKIINIHFPYFTGTPELAQKLKDKITQMQGWTIGTINGKPVCSEVFWGLNCIMWN